MGDGIYSFGYEVEGWFSRGSLTLRSDLANGGDPRVLLAGQLSHAANHIVASLEIQVMRKIHPARLRDGILDFEIRLTGPGSDTHFDVIGVGPRGMIVRLAGEWTSPLASPAR